MKYVGLFFILFFLRSAIANQVPELDKFYVAGWNTSGTSQWVLGYGLNDTVGFSARYDRIAGVAGERDLFVPELDFILKTWQRPGSITRVYFTLGYGAQKHPWGDSGVALADLEIVKESERFYFGERFQYFRMVSHQPFNGMRFRVGYAPGAFESPKFKVWLMTQAERNGAVSNKINITPLVRFKSQAYYGELGASLSGDWALNLGVVY
ncbi:MAG: hypothetical protein AABZ55_06780 [Bdellovibrionota bacterium]